MMLDSEFFEIWYLIFSPFFMFIRLVFYYLHLLLWSVFFFLCYSWYWILFSIVYFSDELRVLRHLGSRNFSAALIFFSCFKLLCSFALPVSDSSIFICLQRHLFSVPVLVNLGLIFLSFSPMYCHFHILQILTSRGQLMD
jgi:hypothetical protein